MFRFAGSFPTGVKEKATAIRQRIRMVHEQQLHC